MDQFSEVAQDGRVLFSDAVRSEEEKFLEDRNSQMDYRIYRAVGTEDPFTTATEDKIRGFLNLSKGWNHGEGIPPSHQGFQIAMEINEFATENGFLTDAVPGLNGEIQVAVYGQDQERSSYLEITTNADCSVNLTRYDNVNGRWEIIEDRVLSPLEDIESLIGDYGREIRPWHISFEYYPKGTITKTLEDFQVRLSKTMRAPYRWYENYVSCTAGIQYAIT